MSGHSTSRAIAEDEMAVLSEDRVRGAALLGETLLHSPTSDKEGRSQRLSSSENYSPRCDLWSPL